MNTGGVEGMDVEWNRRMGKSVLVIVAVPLLEGVCVQNAMVEKWGKRKR